MADSDAPPLLTPETFDHLDGYLVNLASVATQEKITLAQLIESNATLTTNVAALTMSIASLTAAYTLLANKPRSAPSPVPPLTTQCTNHCQFEANGY